MTTEFSQLNSSLITPIMKSKGFRKVGQYDYSPTFDKAVYQLGEKEVQVIFSVHPYDYPEHGVRLKTISNGQVTNEKLYPVQEGGLKYILGLLASDLTEGKICT